MLANICIFVQPYLEMFKWRGKYKSFMMWKKILFAVALLVFLSIYVPVLGEVDARGRQSDEVIDGDLLFYDTI